MTSAFVALVRLAAGAGETNYLVDVEQRDTDRVAAMIVRALREVYGVLHPVYLDA